MGTSGTVRPMTKVSVLQLVRVADGLSQEDLARAAHVSRRTIGLIEGGHAWPRTVTQEALASALGVSREALFPTRASAPEAS
jgi:DNA-binding XRE family transcriptional regulator